jgi:hypothetical protein
LKALQLPTANIRSVSKTINSTGRNPYSSSRPNKSKGEEGRSSEHRRIRKRSPPRGADPIDAGLLRATTTTPPLRPRHCEYETPEHRFSRPLRGILAGICGRTADHVSCGPRHTANTLVPLHVSSSNHHHEETMKTKSTRSVLAAAIAVRRPRSVAGIAA